MSKEISLFIISTPIGNLEDISLRALKCLKQVDFILCEDTRRSIKLLNHFEIQKPLFAYQKHNEYSVSENVIKKLSEGQIAALISDAGTPVISDPGNHLTSRLIEEGIGFCVLPGANAVLPAAIMSGFDLNGFTFLGFLPDKKNTRSKSWEEAINSPYPTIVYIAPHDLIKYLKEFSEIAPRRKLSLSKELTKVHEQTFYGTAEDIISQIGESPLGEYVLVIDKCEKMEKKVYSDDELKSLFAKLKDETGDKKTALKQLSDITKIQKRVLYDMFMK